MSVVSDAPPSTHALVQHAATRLREYLDGGRVRTDLLRDVAADMVEIRSRCFLSDGRADWSGWSSEYRTAASEIYRSAGVPKDDLAKIQTALRYHVQNLIRSRAPENELAAVGLSTLSPKERILRDRAAVNALAAAAADAEGRKDPLVLVSYAEDLVDLIDSARVAALTDVDRRALLLILDDLQSKLAQARNAAAHGAEAP